MEAKRPTESTKHTEPAARKEPAPQKETTQHIGHAQQKEHTGLSEGTYVPGEHRHLEKSTSTFGAIAHILKASLGAGVLAMPLAFKNSGLLVGTIGTIFIGIVCCYSIHILVKTSQALCVELRQPALTYADTCYLVFKHGPIKVQKYARFAKELVDWGLALTHAGACCVYVVVIAETFFQMVPQFGGPMLSVKVYCLLTLLILLPLTQIRTLKYLVPISALADVVWATAITISIYYCLRSPPNIAIRNLSAPIKGLPSFIRPLNQAPTLRLNDYWIRCVLSIAVSCWMTTYLIGYAQKVHRLGLPSSTSTCLFAMECIGVVMPVENEMSHPQQFLGCPGVLNISMFTVTLLFGFVGFFGYWQFGETVKGSLTLNLPQNEGAAQLAKLLVAWVMLLSFALIYYVPVDVVWRKMKDRVPDQKKNMVLAIVRLIGTFLIVGLASALPSIPLFMELVGAFCLSVMGLLLPVIIETVHRWDKDITMFSFTMFKNVGIGVFSLIALVAGVSFAIKAFFN